MAPTINRAGLIADFAPGAIDLDQLTPETFEAIERAAAAAVAQGTADPYLQRLVALGGVRGELARIAGVDRRIEVQGNGSDVELQKLFTFLERFERRRGDQTIDLGGNAAPGPQPTPAGQAYQALKAERRGRDTSRRDQFVREKQAGFFDLGCLTPQDRARLWELRFDHRVLERLGDEGKRLYGGQALGRLFVMLDRLDDRGPDGRLDRRRDGKVSAPRDETRAGAALALLERIWVPFDHLVGKPLENRRVKPKHLDVPHRVQSETSCFDTDKEMVNRFSRGLAGKVPGGNSAFYMARGEDGAGAIFGLKEDFDRGRRIIDATLDSGRPIIVGVSHSRTDTANFDRLTDHFIVVTGRGVDEAGRVFYSFNDSATRDPVAGRAGRLYVDNVSGMLFMPPQPGSYYPATLGYQVTQVRPYVDQPLEDLAGPGQS